MIAFHYPPFAGGTGVHRTLKFSRYLSDFGWQPIVLSANPRAYAKTDPSATTPSGVEVTRAFALDSARAFGIRGRHLQVSALPDRWMTWWLGGVMNGLALIRKHRPDVIWSTSPIPTAHWIAMTLRRRSSLPWVADFRDPMVLDEPDRVESDRGATLTMHVRRRIERNTVRRATRCVFTTSGTLALYARRYPDAAGRLVEIPNGYDEEDFAATSAAADSARRSGPLVLIHSGELYPGGRDPLQFLKALVTLRANGAIDSKMLRVVLRATSDDEHYRGVVRGLQLEDIVAVEPMIPHQAAIREMLVADGLLLMQGSVYNRQVPAKAYEYLRSGRPIFAMTDADSDTAALLRSERVDHIAALDDEREIAERLTAFIADVYAGRGVRSTGPMERYSRKARAGELAAVLDAVVER
jgi:glycosyltransferase involved in cell wall biosynthesis